MHETINATYDGEVLRPDNPIHIKPNTRVRIIVESLDLKPDKSKSFLQTAKSLKIDGPTDWSEKFEDYLYKHDVKNNE